jgi:hypothetical protein
MLYALAGACAVMLTPSSHQMFVGTVVVVASIVVALVSEK